MKTYGLILEELNYNINKNVVCYYDLKKSTSELFSKFTNFLFYLKLY